MLERAKQILRSNDLNLNGNVSVFAKSIGMEQTTVNNYLLGKRKMSLDFIGNILAAYPDISAEWLLRGKGDMTLAKEPMAQQGQAKGDLTDVLSYLTERCKSLEAQLKVLQGEKGIMAV